MILSQFLIPFSGYALVLRNRNVRARFSSVELFLILFVFSYGITENSLALLGEPTDHLRPWHCYNCYSGIVPLILTAVYGPYSAFLHLAILLATRSLAAREKNSAGLVPWTTAFIAIIAAVGSYTEVMLVLDILNPRTSASSLIYSYMQEYLFKFHNVIFLAVSVAHLIALAVTKQKDGVVKHHYNILIACTTLLAIPRLWVNVLFVFHTALLWDFPFSFKVLPMILVVFTAAFYASDFKAMLGDSGIELSITCDDSKALIVSNDSCVSVTVVTDEKLMPA